MAGKYPAWSPYNFVLGNPIRLIDPDGMSVEDIVYYNSKGIEVNRIVTHERYETYVDLKDDGNYTLAPMPNIIKGYESPKYQKYDYLIAAHTEIFNKTPAEERPSTPNNLLLDGDQPTSLSPTLVKAIILKETGIGTIDGKYNQKGTSDIMQANVETKNRGEITGSDWGDYKTKFGLIQSKSATPEQSIFAGIRILYMKGIFVETPVYNDGKLSSDSQVSWKGGNLNSWWEAVKAYNGSSQRESYVNKVYEYWNNSFFSKENKYYKQ